MGLAGPGSTALVRLVMYADAGSEFPFLFWDHPGASLSCPNPFSQYITSPITKNVFQKLEDMAIFLLIAGTIDRT